MPTSRDVIAAPAGESERLMHAFRAGDLGALEALFDLHARRVHTFVLRLSNDPALAEDVTQAAFLSVVKGRDRFEATSRFVPWLYTIALHALRDHQRRRKRESLTADGSMPEVPFDAAAPDLGVERRVREALQRLPEDQRQAVVLHHIEEFPFREIAAMTGASESAIKVRAHRGYSKLRDWLADTWEETR